VIEELLVVVGRRVAARIIRVRGRLELVYDELYRTGGFATPLSVTMSLTETTHPHAVVAPWLAGLLPDDNAVRARWSRQFAVADNPFSLLGTPIGEECAGAARFITADRLDAALAGDGSVTWLSEAELAARIRGLRADASAWLGTDFSGRFSLAGAQAKTALLHDPGSDRWGVPSGTAATSHILKPAITGFDDHDLNEHLCLTAAGRTGLLVAPTALMRFEDQSVIAATRYDRVQGNSPWLTRIHQEDLCQALGLPPDRKYQNEGGPTARDVADLLRQVLPTGSAQEGVWRFFDAVAFNWLIGGTDAHAKNYSLLLSGRQVALAPLYDIASALPYDGMPLKKLRMAMKFGGDYPLTIRTPTMWAKVATEFTLPQDAVRARAAQLMDAVRDAFADAAAVPDVAALGSTLPARLVDAVAEQVARCRSALQDRESATT
jgi:serine/threonine-protein kinase HipA